MGERILRAALAAAGAALILWGLAVWRVSNFNLGNVFTLLLGALLLALGLLLPRLPRFIPIVSGAALFVLLAFICFLFAAGRAAQPPGGQDAAIVLGAGVHGERVSLTLARRLEVALEFAARYPDAPIVVSGGRGPGEDISEAEAMRRYLAARGVDEKRIILEDRSTSTRENFAFSGRLIRERLGKGVDEMNITYITTDYHAFRAGLLARRQGYKNLFARCARLDLFLYPMSYLREAAAALKVLILG